MRKKIVLAMVCCLIIAGCATRAGNEKLGESNSDSISKVVIKGETTKDQLSQQFGQPTKVDFNGGAEQWTYDFARATPQAINFVPIINLFVRGADVNKKQLVVLFDDKGFVKNYSFTDNEGVVKSGVGQ